MHIVSLWKAIDELLASLVLYGDLPKKKCSPSVVGVGSETCQRSNMLHM